MNPVTPAQGHSKGKCIGTGHIGAGHDTPLGEISNVVRESRTPGLSGDKVNKSKVALVRKERSDTLPTATMSEISITRDWDGPEAKVSLRPKSSGIGAGVSRRAERSPNGRRQGIDFSPLYPQICSVQIDLFRKPALVASQGPRYSRMEAETRCHLLGTTLPMKLKWRQTLPQPS